MKGRLVDFVHLLWERKIPFFAVFAVMFTASYGMLVLVDFIPEPPKHREATASTTDTQVGNSAVESIEVAEPEPVIEPVAATMATVDPDNAAPVISSSAAVLPEEIVFDKLDRTVSVLNPTSRAVADLDAALLQGVVRHPDSATFAQTGTMFLLGHSSYLPSVINKNFQAFNGIQKLAWGDVIRVRSMDREYIYRVETVYEAKAAELTVPIAGDKNRLILATCNSFASKDDRFIVEAILVDVVSLAEVS